MKKAIIIILIALGFMHLSNISEAQYLEENSSIKERIFYGGNLGLSFGTQTFISVNPLIGYRITDRISAGLGVNYMYLASNNHNYSYSFYGANVFASYTIFKNINEIMPFISPNTSMLIHAEYSLLNVESFYKDYGIEGKWQQNPMMGPAIQSKIAKRAYIVLAVLYNFNESFYSFYPNPVIRVSVNL